MINFFIRHQFKKKEAVNSFSQFLILALLVSFIFLNWNVAFAESAILNLPVKGLVITEVVTYAYIIVMFLLLIFFMEPFKEEIGGLKNKITGILFGFIWYATLSFFVTVIFLSLNLVFSYNSFLLGYTQSLFFFLFIFLSYVLFRLFAKSYTFNDIINKLTK